MRTLTYKHNQKDYITITDAIAVLEAPDVTDE
jgi:hypothetical protein